jgi:hypothetical protein
MGIIRPIPSISFCDLIKRRDQLLGKEVSIYANMQSRLSIRADLTYIDHGETINDPECEGDRANDTESYRPIEVSYIGQGSKAAELKNAAIGIRDERFGGRARVSVTGILRKVLAGTSGDEYRFEISKFNSIEPIVLPYQGILDLGWTYSDAVDYDHAAGLQLSSPLKVPFHHAARVEWSNLRKFADELRSNGRKYITFRVTSSTVQKIDANRWNTVYDCEIVELK